MDAAVEREIPPAFCGGLIEAVLVHRLNTPAAVNPPRVLRGPH